MNPDLPTRMDTSSPLDIRVQDGIAVLKLNRPDKRNAINDAMIDALLAWFGEPHEGVHAIVLHGEGAHFCAGLDLIEVLAKRPSVKGVVARQRHSRRWHRTFDLMQFGEVPIVSVLQGAVIGGGMELAATTHVRICEESAFFQLPEGQRGIFVGGGASVRVPRIIGAGRVVEMMLTGRTYDAQAALQLGLCHYVVPPGEGLAKAMELAARIASNSPTSNYAVINGINRISDMPHGAGLFAETMVASNTGEDMQARIQGFFDQRKAGKAD